MRALWILALACGCSAPPTVSILVIRADGTPELDELARLRLVVRACDSNQPAVAQNIPIDGEQPPKVEGAVVPGTSFYVWLQGWEPCNPPCIPEGTAQLDDCTCVGDEVPAAQILNYEACTPWIETDSDIRRTFMLAPKADPPLCPPAALTGAECETP